MNTRFNVTLVALLLGVITAASGWLTTHLVQNVVTVPTVEYDIEHDVRLDRIPRGCRSKDSNTIVTIRNLSRTQKFSQLGFILRLPAGQNSGNFSGSDMRPIPPSYVPHRKGEPRTGNYDITYPPTGIQPGTALELIACYGGRDRPTFHIAENSEAVYPVASGGLTWLIRNEVPVLSVLLGTLALWTVAIVPLVARAALGRGSGSS